MQLDAAIYIPFAVIGLWIFTALITKTFPVLTGKRIVLIIAHPDDEAMFFAPTLLSLTRPELGNHVKILCFSSGNADGLGATRKKELLRSARALGVRSDADVFIIDHADFPDSMSASWDARLISDKLVQAFAPDAGEASADSVPKATIDVIVTFDADGVSSHPNHRSLYHGARAFLTTVMQRHAGWECPVKLYSLTTTNVLRKYMSFLDSPATIVSALFRRKEKGKYPTPVVVVSGPRDYRTAQRAMTQAHRSQMVWFRWGYIGFSRYMVVNDLVKEKVP